MIEIEMISKNEEAAKQESGRSGLGGDERSLVSLYCRPVIVVFCRRRARHIVCRVCVACLSELVPVSLSLQFSIGFPLWGATWGQNTANRRQQTARSKFGPIRPDFQQHSPVPP